MLEIIILVIAIAWIATAMTKKGAAPAPERSAPVAARQEPNGQEQQTRVVRALDVEGTESYKGDRKFLKQFNVSSQFVTDIRIVKGPVAFKDLHNRAKDCLTAVYEEGGSRGIEIAEFMFENSVLPTTQALYFVLVCPRGVSPYIVGFVDKAR